MERGTGCRGVVAWCTSCMENATNSGGDTASVLKQERSGAQGIAGGDIVIREGQIKDVQIPLVYLPFHRACRSPGMSKASGPGLGGVRWARYIF